MDRKLIVGTTLLFLAQLFLLLFGVEGLTPSTHLPKTHQDPIGHIIRKKENVKRKSMGSVIWEDSMNADTLLAFDSVLTLDNSSVEIKLKDDIQLQLHENTLVVLEPPVVEKKDSYHIRFSRGDFHSQSHGQRMQIGSQGWSLEAKPGTGLNIKSLSQGDVEVEVLSGAVEVTHESQPDKKQTIENGTRFSIEKDQIGQASEISQNLKILNPSPEHIYAHQFPVQYTLTWQGPAEKIRLLDAHKKETWIPLATTSNEHQFDLGPGQYYLSLWQQNKSSEEVLLKVLSAPKIKYTAPLPRDRKLAGQQTLFAWMVTEGVDQYRVHLQSATTEAESFIAKQNALWAKPTLNGELRMTVDGQDHLGFRIPSYYAQSIYILPNLLMPPKIMPSHPTRPEIRAPAETPKSEGPEKKAPKKGDSAKLWQWLHQISSDLLAVLEVIPRAYADEKMNPTAVEFSWYPVEDADFYHIEISSQADFLKPEVIAKVEKTSFVWRGYPLGKFYWRVAAGSSSGRMGIFSEPAAINLSQPPGKVGEISPGVRALNGPTPVSKKILTADQVAITTPVVETPSKVVSDTEQTPAPNLNPTAYEPKPEAFIGPLPQTNPIKTPQRIHIRNEIRVSQNFFTQKTGFSASLSGLSSYSTELSAEILTGADDKFTGLIHVEKLEWEAQNLPFQKEFSTDFYGGRFFYHLKDNEFRVGGWVESIPVLKRADLEELKPESKWLAGGAMGYEFLVLKDLSISSYGALLAGDSLGALSSANSFNYFWRKDPNPFYVGGHLDFILFFGSQSLSGSNLKTGIHIGAGF